jgi:hypothetical protein
MKNKGLIIGGVAVVAIIGTAMWYNKNKKAGTLPKWLSADGDWNNAGGDCYKNNKGSFDCIGKDGFVRTGSTLKEAQDAAAGMVARPMPIDSYKNYRKFGSGVRMA